jgi:mono/diheme cytochrome c family protein
MGEHTQRPINFTDPSSMLSASPAHLQGKIIRGGMGTGMPSWGAIFTEDQTWALISYLWTFQFSSEVTP